MLILTGCFNREVVRYSGDWPRVADTINMHEISGRYSNAGEGAGDKLWFYLTKNEHSSRDAQVVISVPDADMLRVQLIEGEKTLNTVNLKAGKDFTLKKDHIRLPTESGFESGALGTGAGYNKFYLYRTVDGGLSGKRKGSAAGLCLYVIPTLGVGSKWTHWPKL